MERKGKHLPGLLLTAIFIVVIANSFLVYAYASDGEEYITISVEAEDDNGTLLYALDTDVPNAFGTSNEFTVPAGTEHVIYVKDAAGNITSEEFKPSVSGSDDEEEGEDGRQVNIDVILDDSPMTDYSDYEYAGDSIMEPAELGQGTVYERVETNAADAEAQRLFYTVTTDEGEVFYLVIDQGQSSNNVYLLDQVNLSDLNALAANDQNSSSSEETESLLSSLSQNTATDYDLSEQDQSNSKSRSSNKFTIIILILCAVGGGVYYYFKIYKDKKDEQMDLVDAFDRDDFAVEEEDDEEEADFGLDEDYQEQTMAMLLSDDDEYMQSLAYENDEIVSDVPEEAQQEAFKPDEEEDEEYDEEYDEELDAPDEEEEEEEE